MTQTRETSRASYETLVASGKLKGQQALCLEWLIAAGTATSGEVITGLGIPNKNAWRARFTELAGRGLIREVGERKCKVSGRLSVVWAPTGRTKPLDAKRGAVVVGLTTWRSIAERLAAHLASRLESMLEHAEPEFSKETDALLAEYRKLSGLDRKGRR